jgi:hypothetical protein
VRRFAGTHRDLIVSSVVLFAALIASGIVSYLNQPGENGFGPRYSTYSADGDGTLALYRWLASLGYRVRRVESVPFSPAGDLDALFVVAPTVSYAADEAGRLVAWVRDGATAVVALEWGADQDALLRALGARLEALPAEGSGAASTARLAPAQPLLLAPPVGALAPLPVAGVRLDEADSVTYLTAGPRREPVLVGRRLGRGLLFVLGAPAVLSNAYIQRADDRRLPLNLLAGLRAGATVGFDEFHHGVQVQTAQDAGDLLFSTPLGRALLYGGVILLGFLLLSGRRLGRPVVERVPPARSIAEYIVSLGALFRRSGARADALAIIVRDFTHEVAGAYHVREVVDGVGGARSLVDALSDRGLLGAADADELLKLLEPVPDRALDEGVLVRRVRALDAVRATLRRGPAPGG